MVALKLGFFSTSAVHIHRTSCIYQDHPQSEHFVRFPLQDAVSTRVWHCNFYSYAVQRLLWAQYKSFKHYYHHITRNATWKLAVWFTWHQPCVLELCHQLICTGICNLGLFWTFVEHFCNFSLCPAPSRLMSMCMSSPLTITHNFNKEKTCLKCDSRLMGHHVEYHYSSIGFLH